MSSGIDGDKLQEEEELVLDFNKAIPNAKVLLDLIYKMYGDVKKSADDKADVDGS